MSRSLSVLCVLCVLCVLLVLPSAAVASPAMDRKAAWTEIDHLIKELKLQEAAHRLDEILPAIRESGDAEEITRALVRGSQLRAASAEPGEAVRFLQSQPWPEGRQQRAVLSLFMAEALKNYYDNYRWKMWENEAVLSDQPVDVEKWTTGQLFEAVSK